MHRGWLFLVDRWQYCGEPRHGFLLIPIGESANIIAVTGSGCVIGGAAPRDAQAAEILPAAWRFWLLSGIALSTSVADAQVCLRRGRPVEKIVIRDFPSRPQAPRPGCKTAMSAAASVWTTAAWLFDYTRYSILPLFVPN